MENKEYFNTTLVRLKELIPVMLRPALPNFNTTLVRLKEDIVGKKRLNLSNFNTTLVRLKEVSRYDIV